MRAEAVKSLVDRVVSVDAGCTDWPALRAAVEDLRRLKSWVEGREVAFAQQIAKVSSFPEKSLAEASRTSVQVGGKVLQRSQTAATMPELGASLDAGRVCGEHVDVMTRVLCYTRTKLHHIIWWRNGGLTNLENLLPKCERHHQKIHHDGWTVTLGENRELTIPSPTDRS